MISFLKCYVAATQTQCIHKFRTACAIATEKIHKTVLDVFIRSLMVAQLFASLFGWVYRVAYGRQASNNKDAICWRFTLCLAHSCVYSTATTQQLLTMMGQKCFRCKYLMDYNMLTVYSKYRCRAISCRIIPM